MASFLDTAKNLAYEFSGAGDIMRGSRELAKGNVAGGLGRLALGAAGFIPVVGTGARAALTGSRLAKGSKFAQAATKTKPAQVIARPVQAAARTKPVQTIARPVQAAGRKTTQAITSSKKLSTPLIGSGAKTKLGKFAAATTTPYSISRIISQATLRPNVAGAAQPQGPNIFDAAQRSWEQTQLAAALMGTNVPKTGGGTPGTGGGSGPGGTGPGTSVTPGYGPRPEGAGIPEIVVPPLGGGIGVGGGTGETGTSEINTGGEESLMGGTGAMMVGTPGDVAKAGAQYGAGLAGLAAQNRLRDAGLRELFSQGMMGVRGTAADILGGRSAAIRGQGVTGVRRAFQTGLAQAAQDRIAEESALARTYGNEVAAGYQKAAQDAMDLAQRRSEAAARIRSLG